MGKKSKPKNEPPKWKGPWLIHFFKTTFTSKDYEQVRTLGLEYFKRKPRSVA